MVTEDPQRARTSSGPRGTAPTARAPAAGESGDSAVDLAEVERAVRELLGRYRIALEFASDMPMLGRSRMSRGRPRWGSRFFTRVYVETHVRKQLKAIRECLRLTRLSAAEAEEAQRITALEEELDRHAEPLFGWRRLAGLVVRLPPVAAALPIVSAASAWPLADEVSIGRVRDALLVLVGSAALLWVLVVWPSIRLGFRVKRAIFAGGSDLRHPLPGDFHPIDWTGFPAPRFYDEKGGGRRMPFPEINVYRAENDVFRALGRRKPAEAPLDMLLGLAPYLWTAYSVFFVYGLIDAVTRGERGEVPWGGVLLGAALALVPLGFAVYGTRSYRERRH